MQECSVYDPYRKVSSAPQQEMEAYHHHHNHHHCSYHPLICYEVTTSSGSPSSDDVGRLQTMWTPERFQNDLKGLFEQK